MAVRDALVAAARTIIEAFPEYGYLIVMVRPDESLNDGVNYATNFEEEGLHAVAEAFSASTSCSEREFASFPGRTIQ